MLPIVARQLPNYLLLAVLITLSYRCIAEEIELSDSSNITLITCSPGEELYSAFGHNGIRVTDYQQGFDVVFNYGTFDFNQSGFYSNFVLGRMRYMLSTDRFEDFIAQYKYEQRSVIEQQLRLTPEDKKQIFSFLFHNAQPENREYLYDFFWDNCATRPRDVFEKQLKERLQFQLDSSCGFETGKTMHDMLRIYVGERIWAAASFDLILGLPCEVPATPRHQTFLPDYLVKYFNCSTLDGLPFVTGSRYLLQYPPPVFNIPFTPLHLCLIILAIGVLITIINLRHPYRFRWFDFILFFSTGLMGLLFLSLWIFSSHYSVPKNMNMFWLIPTHVLVPFFLIRKNIPYLLRYYFLITAVVQMLLLILWKWNPQPFNIAFIPVIVLMAVRSFALFHTLTFIKSPNRDII